MTVFDYYVKRNEVDITIISITELNHNLQIRKHRYYSRGTSKKKSIIFFGNHN